jgi:uncharacterized membrane protein
VTERGSRLLALAAVATLAVVLLLPARPAGAIAALPLGILLITGLKARRYWGVAVAGLMLPYFCYGVMRMLTEPAGRTGAAAFAGLAVCAFLAALDSMRRRRARLNQPAPGPSARRVS